MGVVRLSLTRNLELPPTQHKALYVAVAFFNLCDNQ